VGKALLPSWESQLLQVQYSSCDELTMLILGFLLFVGTYCSPIQLSLYPCTAGVPAEFVWAIGAHDTVINSNTGQCVTYDGGTTNLIMSDCISGGDDTQSFFFNSSNGLVTNPNSLCWDIQYYGNASGSVLGLYTCDTNQAWNQFIFNASSGFITNTQNGVTQCVNGGLPPLPIPTAYQLAWTRTEVSVMISYDLITQLPDVPNPQHFCINAGGDSGFPVPPPSAFNPSNLSTDSWIAAALAVDAKYTLLVASHCSGFLLWPSKVQVPRYGVYNYTVASSPWKDGGGNVVEEYVASSRAAGLPYAFYLTWNYNYLFNAGCCNEIKPPSAPGQFNLSLEEYHQVMADTMEEVWSTYPDIMECWFDGGESNAPLNALLQKYQPNAVLTDGDLAPNYARLVGFESGYAPYPVWSTATAPAADGSGDPNGGYFVPPEADTPVAEHDAWFWKPATTYRPLAELQSVYLNTVGANSLLELGILPDDTGAIPADQMAVLQSLGDWIRRCHSPAAALAANMGVGASISITLAADAAIDRVILQEDQTFGQIVRAFQVFVSTPGGYKGELIQVADGTAIGNKRILYFQTGPIATSYILINATEFYPGYTSANWRNVAVYTPCE
jgi:alpha-L-fucosidase